MKIITPQEAEKINAVTFDAYKLLSNGNTEIIQLSLKTSESMARHKNPYDVIFYIISGQGILEADDQRYALKSGTCIEIEKEIERGWLNSGSNNLDLLVIKILK